MKRSIITMPLLPLLHLVAGCGGGDSAADWAGSVDTLPSGMVVVTNPAQGVWDEATAWRVTPVVRIGVLEGEGPDLFGSITAIEVDPAGRIWVLDGQAQELRVFDADGRFVRTIGRKGGGPGEFNQVMGMAWDAAGRLWVVDPRNNRISILDTAGTFLTSHRTQGGFISMPWPGGFDDAGYFYNIAPYQSGTAFRMALVKYDTTGTALDTIHPPRWQGPENFFEHVSNDGNSRMRTGVPYTPGLLQRFTRSGDFWFAHTGPYELYFRTAAGDTLLMATKPFDPLPVSSADRDSAIAGLEWFTGQGGRVDRSRIPNIKPAIRGLHVGEDGTVWIVPTRPTGGDTPGTLFDVFAPNGRYLGQVHTPFPVSGVPIIRGGRFVTVSRDELEVQYVVVARVENYTTPELRDRPRGVPLGGSR